MQCINENTKNKIKNKNKNTKFSKTFTSTLDSQQNPIRGIKSSTTENFNSGWSWNPLLNIAFQDTLYSRRLIASTQGPELASSTFQAISQRNSLYSIQPAVKHTPLPLYHSLRRRRRLINKQTQRMNHKPTTDLGPRAFAPLATSRFADNARDANASLGISLAPGS